MNHELNYVAKALADYATLKDQGLTQRAISAQLGIPRTTLQRWLAGGSPAELEVPSAPSTDEPIEDLVARKKAAYDRFQRYEDWSKLVEVKVNIGGPVAICAVGDPHVDNDLCDIGAIERDMTVIGRTPGAYALHLGDITDNWIGNLGRLYAHSSTKASDGIRLAQWMFGMAPPIAVVGGNHDCWNDGMTWLNFVLKQAGNPVTQEHGVRLALNFPNGNALRIHARHDFPGHSQYNPLHGLRKEHLFGLRDHVNIAGHKHTDSAAVVPSPEGFCQWMLRVSGYKAHDDYAKKGHYQLMKMAPTVGLLIDPDAKNPAEFLKPWWDLEAMADYLTFRRKRAGW